MALALNEEQIMLRDMARNFFAAKSPVGEFRKVRQKPLEHRYSEAVWNNMVELGWSSALIPENLGGCEFGVIGTGLICIESARTLAPTPLVTTAAIAAQALLECEASLVRDQLLRAIANGSRTVTYAHNEGSHYDPEKIRTLATLDNNCFSINGTKQFVPEASYADICLVVAIDTPSTDTQPCLYAVDMQQEGIENRAVSLIDYRQYANLEFKNVRVSAAKRLKWAYSPRKSIAFIENTATILTACELYGCSLEVFSRTIDYLKERSQFGRKIGSFQALQHRAAHAYTQLELLKTVVLDALSAANEQTRDLSIAASHVKALANDTAHLVMTESIQMHGGIGITDELDIGLFYKRARVLRTRHGSSDFHRARFASLNGY